MSRRSLILTAVFGVCLGPYLSACGVQDPASYSAYGVDKGAGSVGIHTVLSGDTVYKIAKNYQLPMREIITLNHMEAPYVLNTGFRMKLPPPNEHEVREGDTLSSIARMYELSVNRLARLNNINAPYRIVRGQKLRLPSTASPSYSSGQSARAQKTSFAEPVKQGRIQKSVTNTAIKGVGKNASKAAGNSTVTPDKKPYLKKVSARPTKAYKKVSKHTPRMSKSGGNFMRPVNGRIISQFGPKKGGLYNDGINIKAVRGSAVRAAENGVVVYTGDDLEGYGNLILVRHQNRMMSAYAHLDKTLIKRGAKVVRGQSIGTVGSTGQVDSPQLHFEIRKGSKPLNPMKYL